MTDVEYKYRRRNAHTEFLSRVAVSPSPKGYSLFEQEGELSRKTVFVVKPLRQVPRLSFNI